MLNTLSPVLWLRYFDDLERNIQQMNRGKRIGLLAVEKNHEVPSSACVISFTDNLFKSAYASPVKVENMNISLTNCNCGFSTGVVINVLRFFNFKRGFFFWGVRDADGSNGSCRNVTG